MATLLLLVGGYVAGGVLTRLRGTTSRASSKSTTSTTGTALPIKNDDKNNNNLPSKSVLGTAGTAATHSIFPYFWLFLGKNSRH